MSDNKREYRSIVKGASIFGGVQIFQMFINVLRGKFIAIFLGVEGMGVSALLTSTVNTINQVSSLGLSVGAMRDISMANESGDIVRLSIVAKIFRKIVFITGIIGAAISVIGSVWWSELAFGNRDYTIAFVILGVMLFFTALSVGETTLLQGTRHLKYLAKTSLFGSLIGLLVGIPLYYFYGKQGIAPGMAALALMNYISNRYFTSKIPLKHVVVDNIQMQRYAKSMIGLGVTLTVASLLGTLTTYFINWFIRYNGNIGDVGLYQAATSLTTQYVGFIFTAMAVDYFPRLSAISEDVSAIKKLVNQQAEIMILIIVPIIIFLFATAPFIIKVLLSEDFIQIVPVIRWIGFALFFKALAYPLGYISFAKGDKKVFFYIEGVFGNLNTIVFSITGYMLWGIMGLGIAILFSYVTYVIILGLVVKSRYSFSFSRELIMLSLLLLCVIGLTLILSLVIKDDLIYASISFTILIIVGYYCFRELDKRIFIMEMIKNKFTKK